MVFRRRIFLRCTTELVVRQQYSVLGSLDNTFYSRIARCASNSTRLDKDRFGTDHSISTSSMYNFSSFCPLYSLDYPFSVHQTPFRFTTLGILGLSAPLEAFITRFLFD